MLLAEFEHSPSAHNGARWSELALTPGSHLGPFNDLQIYHPCLGELATLLGGGAMASSEEFLLAPCFEMAGSVC